MCLLAHLEWFVAEELRVVVHETKRILAFDRVCNKVDDLELD